ncbi:hypothetical protein FOL47_007584 [Perkinsus chesapeaki]|uniref:Uncharacterized protein n=1 Tax=Perkinsus chesapeaki TaxID=330153 RepID=A0A7J6LJH4_PERCH|nr:hypothetical protein FOL47_007584 [Perkinsus chesapeaki]
MTVSPPNRRQAAAVFDDLAGCDVGVQTDAMGELDRLRTELAFERRRAISLERQYTRSEVDRLDMIARNNTLEVEIRRLEQQLAHNRDFHCIQATRESIEGALRRGAESLLSGGPHIVLSMRVESARSAGVNRGDYCWVEIRISFGEGGRLVAAGRTHQEVYNEGEVHFGGVELEMACNGSVTLKYIRDFAGFGYDELNSFGFGDCPSLRIGFKIEYVCGCEVDQILPKLASLSHSLLKMVLCIWGKAKGGEKAYLVEKSEKWEPITTHEDPKT